MQQQAHLFQWLEATKTKRVCITHNMGRNKEILASLEIEKSEATAA